MANSAQAKKRARQAEATRQRNASLKSELRTAVKKVRKAIAAGDKAAAAKTMQESQAVMDRIADKKIVHKNMVVAHQVAPGVRHQGAGLTRHCLMKTAPAGRRFHSKAPMTRAAPQHFLQFKDFTSDELAHLFERTRWIKERFKRYELYQPLRDRTLAMVFEKASTRTRVSFEAGMNQLGGIAINLNRGDTQLSRGEPIEDVARVISRMVDVVMIRTFEQTIIERFAAHSRVPVINGLTNEYHPCQILADIYTYVEHRGTITGKHGGVDRRRQQRLQHVGAGRGDPRLHRARRDAARLRSERGDRRAVPRALPRRSPIRWKRAAARTSSPPTCGPAWASRPRTTRASARSPTGWSTPT